MMTRIVRELIRMLKVAVFEIREHNREYHHVTPEPLLEGWEEFITKVEKSL